MAKIISNRGKGVTACGKEEFPLPATVAEAEIEKLFSIITDENREEILAKVEEIRSDKSKDVIEWKVPKDTFTLRLVSAVPVVEVKRYQDPSGEVLYDVYELFSDPILIAKGGKDNLEKTNPVYRSISEDVEELKDLKENLKYVDSFIVNGYFFLVDPANPEELYITKQSRVSLGDEKYLFKNIALKDKTHYYKRKSLMRFLRKRVNKGLTEEEKQFVASKVAEIEDSYLNRLLEEEAYDIMLEYLKQSIMDSITSAMIENLRLDDTFTKVIIDGKKRYMLKSGPFYSLYNTVFKRSDLEAGNIYITFGRVLNFVKEDKEEKQRLVSVMPVAINGKLTSNYITIKKVQSNIIHSEPPSEEETEYSKMIRENLQEILKDVKETKKLYRDLHLTVNNAIFESYKKAVMLDRKNQKQEFPTPTPKWEGIGILEALADVITVPSNPEEITFEDKKKTTNDEEPDVTVVKKKVPNMKI